MTIIPTLRLLIAFEIKKIVSKLSVPFLHSLISSSCKTSIVKITTELLVAAAILEERKAAQRLSSANFFKSKCPQLLQLATLSATVSVVSDTVLVR